MCTRDYRPRSGSRLARRRRRRLFPLVLLLSVIIGSGYTYGASSFSATNLPDRKPQISRLTIVSIPGWSFQEFEWIRSLPTWDRWLTHASYAAMNVRTPEAGIEDVYLSIGAGAPALGRREDQGYGSDEVVMTMAGKVRADQLYARYTGADPQPAGIVIPTQAYLQRWNASQPHSAVPGTLGEALQTIGIKRFVYGNRDQGRITYTAGGDAASLIFRHAPLMLADHRGLLDGGRIGADILADAPARPFGVRTDYAKILQELDGKQQTVILIELGDLDRLYAEKHDYEEQRFHELRRTVLSEIDTFLGHLMAQRGNREAIWIFSPMTHAEARRDKSLLAPFYAFDPAWSPGMLTSGTTRRDGMIAYQDIAPTILQRFDPAAQSNGLPAHMRGSEIVVAKRASSGIVGDAKAEHSQLLQEIKNVENVHSLRPRLSYPLVTAQAITLFAGLLFVFLPTRPVLSQWMRAMLLSILAVPVLLLLLGKFPAWPHTALILLFCVALVSVGWILHRLPLRTALFAVSAITACMILVDGFFGAETMQHSILGYDPIIGARFYGIGNEFMGVLIGSSLLALSVWQQGAGRQTLAPWLVFIPIVIYMAAPFWGTNAGGTIAACIAFAAYAVQSRYVDESGIRLTGIQRPSSRWILFSLALAAAAGGSLALLWLMNRVHINIGMTWDAATGAGSSHIGKAFEALMTGRFDIIIDLVRRKVAMNVRLLSVSFWSKLLAAGMVVLVATAFSIRNKKRQKAWYDQDPHIAAGCRAITVGAIAAFLANDSGIVAAATMIVYAAVPVLLFHQRNDSHSA